MKISTKNIYRSKQFLHSDIVIQKSLKSSSTNIFMFKINFHLQDIWDPTYLYTYYLFHHNFVRMSLFIHGNARAHVKFQPSLVVCMFDYPPCSLDTLKDLQKDITNTIKSNFVISLSMPHTSYLSKDLQLSSRFSLSCALGSISISQKDSNINTSSIL